MLSTGPTSRSLHGTRRPTAEGKPRKIYAPSISPATAQGRSGGCFHAVVGTSPPQGCPLFLRRGQDVAVRDRDAPTHADWKLHHGGASANGSFTLGAQRCRGLLTIAFGLLFIFRSHYFYTIGLDAIFSLRRTSPADLHFTLKKRDSWTAEGVDLAAPTSLRDVSPPWMDLSRSL